MDNQNISEDLRKKVYDDLADAMVAALSQGEMLVKESEESSEYILEKMDNITTNPELITFLHGLAQRWPAYSHVFTQYKSQELLDSVHKELDQLASAQK